MKQKLILFCIFYTFCCVNVMAQIGKTFKAVNTDGCKLMYKITSENTCMLMRNEKSYQEMTKIVVPETTAYKGKNFQVTEIEAGCFRFLSTTEYIAIPHSIKELKSTEESVWVKAKLGDIDHTDIHHYGMFHGCINLKTVILPESLSSIGPLAFWGCSSLVEIELPSGLKDVGGGCFYGCTSLRKATLPPRMTKLNDAEYYHAKYAYSTMGYYDKHYHGGFFQNCTSLEGIEIPSSVTEIGSKCFYGCKSLNTVKGFHSKINIHETHDQWGYQRGSSYELFENSMINLDSIKATFSYFAEGLIIEELKKWQQKKEFETNLQYQTRVTKENREKKLHELIAHYKKKYIEEAQKESKLEFSLGNYDTEYNVFSVTDKHLGTKYVKVPKTDEIRFRENFKNATIKPTFDVVDNNFALVELSVIVNGNTYNSEQAVIDEGDYLFALNIEDSDLNLDVATNNVPKSNIKASSIDYSIDHNIPVGLANNKQSFAVIIGNERYTQVAQVPYANNDARIFAEYCKKTLGLPVQNVRLYENTTFGTMLSAMADVKKIAEAYNGDINVIFYYAGHGVPNESTKDAFLLPVDADGQQTEVCYPISRLYKELGAFGAKNVVVFMDACFSGAQRGEGMLASARGVALKAKAEAPQGNMVVFSAATGDETAYPYKEKGHGMFTYFLLKKLQESKGDCTLQELGEYIQTNVRQQSVVINRKSQTPTVVPSAGIGESWKTMKLK